CWVMRIKEEGEAAEAEPDSLDEEGDAREKVIVRSDGTVTYVGKDIAYQYWKFGLLDRDFHYRVYDRLSDSHTLWATTSVPAHNREAPVFGRAETTYNVIDVRQSYLQKLLKQALTTLGHFKEAEHSVHFSYEMVALSPETARTLGYVATELESGRPFVEVSGRKGQGVKADDLLDALFEKARREVIVRNPALASDEQRLVAQQIACAAVRYFMLKYSRSRVIAFDLDEALNFEGESGPYLQYAVVRATNIFGKLREREGIGEQEILAALETSTETTLEAEGDEIWALVLESARLDEMVAQVVRSLEFSVLAKYALSLAQMFNAFYHKYQILREERPDVRMWRAAAVMYFQRQLTRTLALMGLSVPGRM
ncbi:MAG: arginine--tRNA ligase, partial [Acidimicrobiia bacterium]